MHDLRIIATLLASQRPRTADGATGTAVALHATRRLSYTRGVFALHGIASRAEGSSHSPDSRERRRDARNCAQSNAATSARAHPSRCGNAWYRALMPVYEYVCA